MKIPKTDMDYVELYANRLKKDNTIFKQQKIMIESQIAASSSLFKQWFGTGIKFKKSARQYLKDIGLL